MEKSKGRPKGRKGKTGGWVSKNRILVGDTKSTSARNPNFDTDETQLLITLWGDPKFQKTLITSHRKHTVIKTLADEMAKNGYKRSVEELSTRIKNLKCFYNRLKKEQESGVCSDQPTWKHYEAMDIIMNRRIFSVRPDEVAEPSLRYRLEQEKHERAEKCTHNESVSIENDALDDYKNTSIKIKEESRSDIEEEKVPMDSLLIPKQETIDVDDSDEEFRSDNIPIITSSKQINRTSKSISPNVLQSDIGVKNLSSSPVSQVAKPSLVLANRQHTQFGKIALVPTNLLVQKKNSENLNKVQTANGFSYVHTHPNSNTRIVADKTGGMKVLLVNAADRKEGNLSNSKNLISKNSTQHTLTGNPTTNSSKTKNDLASEDFDNLFTALIAAQKESIDIQTQQLEVERERLHCQKSLTDKIFSAFPSLFGS